MIAVGVITTLVVASVLVVADELLARREEHQAERDWAPTIDVPPMIGDCATKVL